MPPMLSMPQLSDDPVELRDEVLNDASLHTAGALPETPIDISNGAALSPAETSGIAKSPFVVSVNKVQQPKYSSTVCLEIRIQNTSAELVRGQIWLADKLGNEGRPETFVLPARTNTAFAADEPQTAFPQLCALTGALSHVAVRIQPANSGVAFWQGDLLLHRENDGSITVEIDKSVRAATSLGGIDKGVVNIYAGEMAAGTWQPVSLRLRGPKDLAHPTDAQRPQFSGRSRPKRRNESSATPAVGSARLTLSRTLDCGREAYVQLIAGRTVHIGRARSWDSAAHADYLPNDIVLRSIVADEADDYISRYHGRIHITHNDVRYENLSNGGTDVGGKMLTTKGESLSLTDNSVIQPGCAVASNQNRSLGLRVRRTPSKIPIDPYVQLAQDAHLTSSMDPSHAGETVTLNRTDAVHELEQYVLFPQSTLIGSSESMCGWQISDVSVQPVHAILSWFDESFWIEPNSSTSVVRVDGLTIPVHRLRRLTSSVTVEIGDLRFMVLPEWRQHIMDCRCCTGHG